MKEVFNIQQHGFRQNIVKVKCTNLSEEELTCIDGIHLDCTRSVPMSEVQWHFPACEPDEYFGRHVRSLCLQSTKG